jgi:hypothetical protein
MNKIPIFTNFKLIFKSIWFGLKWIFIIYTMLFAVGSLLFFVAGILLPPGYYTEYAKGGVIYVENELSIWSIDSFGEVINHFVFLFLFLFSVIRNTIVGFYIENFTIWLGFSGFYFYKNYKK